MDKIITRAWTFNIIETIQHDLVHDKTAKKKARVEARFGALEHDLMQSDARQAGEKKSTHWSKIWCTTNREKKQQYNSSSSIAANLANQSVDEV